MVKNIVVLSFTRMGDLVQSAPLLRSFRCSYPDACLTMIVLKQFAETARMLPMVDQVIEFNVDRFISALDERGARRHAHDEIQSLLACGSLREIDLLINLSHTKQSATLCSLLNPRQCIGMYRDHEGCVRVNNEWIHYLLSIMEDRSLNPFNLVEIYSRLHRSECHPNRLELKLPPAALEDSDQLLCKYGVDPAGKIIALQPGASHPSRCWPPERFAELARRLAESGLQVIILGDKSEKQLADHICRLSGEKAQSIAGQTTVSTLAACLSKCRLLISNDTGTAHIAAAVNTPVLALFLGPASAKDTAPYGSDHIILEADLPCAPCDYKKLCANPACKSMIDVDTVFKFARGILGASETFTHFPDGVKASRTFVGSKGSFKLNRLSRGVAQENGNLVFYREFWNRLLNAGEEREGAFTKPILRSVQVLNRLFTEANQAVKELESLLREASSAQDKSAILELQTKWQNDLRAQLNTYPEIAPFVRFLLVKCVLSRTNSLKNYIADLTDVLEYFGRGLELMDASASAVTADTVAMEEHSVA